jgi:cell division septation protein DedD
VIGVMLGATLDGPRLLVRRWTEEVKVLELPRPSVEAPALEQFEKLQGSQPPLKPASELENQPPSKPTRPEPPPASVPQKQDDTRQQGRSTQSTASASPSPEQLIAEIQKRREVTAPIAGRPSGADPRSGADGRSGPTVQVAAYRDVSAAETLVRRLRRVGYDAYLSDRRADGPNQHRVRVQPPRGSSVKTLASTLEERGYGVWITRE